MAKTSRQTNIFGVNDWKTLYQTYSEADFQSYDFETLRKSFVDYLRIYYPEYFNDFTESSELIALTDIIAFMGQSLAFRSDLNTRESYMDTAERRDSVVKLANLVGYTAKRNTASHGYLKITSIQTTENVLDYNGNNLSNLTITWADPANYDWREQWTAILNATLINAQRIGDPGHAQNILGVQTDEYSINLVPGYLPIVPFTATIDNINMPFEVVSVTSLGANDVYEPAPQATGAFNILFRNDHNGFASNNTGYFLYFKQGVIQSQDFNLAERISNRIVNINIEGINNTDRWLFQLDSVGAVQSEWKYIESVYAGAVEQLGLTDRNLYSVSSRTNDQISLVFGDGIFSTIPVGTFRCYARSSNGLQYVINPEEMQSIIIPINYVSRTGSVETLTITCGITTPVTNAQSRETIADIKQRAPARYYTQNRMVTGEDYSNFPYTQYNSIIKSHALNRASIGTSRFLDLLDPTNKYSSTDTFASDGALFELETLPSFTFTWTDANDIYDIITNRIRPIAGNEGMVQFYRANCYRPNIIPLGVSWVQCTRLINETSGYFKNTVGDIMPVDIYASGNMRYVQVGALLKFIPPEGYYFNSVNNLILGTPTKASDKMELWAAPGSVFQDGTGGGEGALPDGTGPITLNTFIPTDAILDSIIPVFVTDLPTTLVQQMIVQVTLNRNFGLGYDNTASEWYLITATNLAPVTSDYSVQYAHDDSNANLDASWLINATVNNGKYTVTNRALEYFFGSVLQTRFFFTGNDFIFDTRTGTVIQDYINILKTNSAPDSGFSLPGDMYLRITGQPVLSDGYVNDFQVMISYYDSTNSGAPDNPDFFNTIVAPDVSPPNKLVFLEQVIDFDNLQRLLIMPVDSVVVAYPTLADIELAKEQYLLDQVFYAWNDDVTKKITDQNFYVLKLNTDGTKYIAASSDYVAYKGRQDLQFQYRHNAPATYRIDPGISNIIDVFVVTQQYYTAYMNWIQDSTGTVVQPDVPTIDELTTEYTGLQKYKMISDNLVINSVSFKPLFGPKADAALQATIKVIKVQNTTASDSQVKSLVVSYMNQYFDINRWNFGDTFYFSELSAYLHQNVGDVVSSVVLVPMNPLKAFGDLYEVRAAPNEIFVNAATVDDVEVISALTSTNLQTAPGSGTI